MGREVSHASLCARSYGEGKGPLFHTLKRGWRKGGGLETTRISRTGTPAGVRSLDRCLREDTWLCLWVRLVSQSLNLPLFAKSILYWGQETFKVPSGTMGTLRALGPRFPTRRFVGKEGVRRSFGSRLFCVPLAVEVHRKDRDRTVFVSVVSFTQPSPSLESEATGPLVPLGDVHVFIVS